MFYFLCLFHPFPFFFIPLHFFSTFCFISYSSAFFLYLFLSFLFQCIFSLPFPFLFIPLHFFSTFSFISLHVFSTFSFFFYSMAFFLYLFLYFCNFLVFLYLFLHFLFHAFFQSEDIVLICLNMYNPRT